MTVKQYRHDLNLFNKTKHNPSYASLTQNFDLAHELKDFCIPVNSYFPPRDVMDSLYEKLPFALKYYPGSNDSIAENIAAFGEIDDPEWIVAGNGSTEIISWLNSIFIKESLFVPVPSFGRWVEEPEGLGTELHILQVNDERQQRVSPQEYVDAVLAKGSRNAVICNPNNPTGTLFSREEILWILRRLSHLDNVVIDESFIDFTSLNPPSIKNDVHRYPNAWVLKSLGKNLGLHGLRMGYAISCKENIKEMRRHLPFWNVNGITEMLLSLIKDQQVAYKESCARTIEDAQNLARRMGELDVFTVFPTNSNFVFVRLSDEIDGEVLRNRMLQNQSCFIRNCGNKLGSSSQYFRVAGRPSSDVDLLISAFQQEIAAMLTESYTGRLLTAIGLRGSQAPALVEQRSTIQNLLEHRSERSAASRPAAVVEPIRAHRETGTGRL